MYICLKVAYWRLIEMIQVQFLPMAESSSNVVGN